MSVGRVQTGHRPSARGPAAPGTNRHPTVHAPPVSAARASRSAMPSSASDEGQTDLAADIVDDLQHALTIWQILHAEFLHEPCVVDQVIPGGLPAAGFTLEADLGIGQEFANDVSNLAQADRDAAGVVHTLLGFVGQQDAGEYLGDIIDMDRAAHRIFVGERYRLALRRLGDDVHVVYRATYLVRSGDISRA